MWKWAGMLKGLEPEMMTLPISSEVESHLSSRSAEVVKE